MFIVILFLVVLLVVSCVLPDFSVASLKQMVSEVVKEKQPTPVAVERAPMRMPRPRKCKVVDSPPLAEE